ncbi:hypothetical protein BJV85_002726 [Clostridium acetobutylicum]|nr:MULTISPECIES: hypothetical protein [Clostridium]NOV90094.1 hypothetical protein [Clostridium acetobutylicum]NOW15379.1 hypothetical protein [Clostridium acetobutylicum]NRY57058.1 hypothetical protein [Clostridium acetobutylicum]NSA93803.1 hypothetical protein [Clostridium acetobutylicum]NYC94929.1 hypothetical protein [Clostridium acetobutylicum]
MIITKDFFNVKNILQKKDAAITAPINISIFRRAAVKIPSIIDTK